MGISIFSSSKLENPIGSWPLQKHRKMSKCPCMASSDNFSVGDKKNLYKVLSLDSENVSVDEIKKAYRSMALHCHPDVCPPSRREKSTRMFVELQRAYETLSDPVLRRRYDHELHLVGLRENSPNGVRTSGLRKKAWESQLSGLEKRSNERVEIRKSVGFV